jgi:predicted nucleic acid-binding Zn ribbon protein
VGPRQPGARQKALAQWRGVDLAPLEEAQSLRAQPLSRLLPKVLQQLRFEDRRREAEILKVWNTLLDPRLVAHAQPTGLRNGTLFVSVDSSVWLSELVRYRRKEILSSLQHCFGRKTIARISFRVG